MSVIQKKICLLGDFAVGKTSLIRRFVEDRFDDKYLSTIGVKISRKTTQMPTHQLNLLVWDMTGGEELGTHTRTTYLRGAAGALMVCDLTRRETMVVFERYIQQMRLINPQTHLIFIGNKVDLTQKLQVSEADFRNLCRELGSNACFLTSARTGQQVEAAFLHLAQLLDTKP